MIAWFKRVVTWKWIGGAAVVIGLLIARLSHNWRKSKQAELDGAARAAERRRAREAAKVTADAASAEAQEASRKADEARRVAEKHRAQADAIDTQLDAIDDQVNDLLSEAKKHRDAESIDAWARRLGY